ncbi:MAG: hypothetical protein JJ879_01690 [Sneathiella sp.]|nr:hypothetical protein [Sneathiella sp.]
MDRYDSQNSRKTGADYSSGLEHSTLLDPSVWGWRLLVRTLIVLNILGVLGIAVISYRADKAPSVAATSCPPCIYAPSFLTIKHWEIRI